MAEKNTTCIYYLDVKEFSEILHIHLALIDVNDYDRAIEHSAIDICVYDRLCNVAELTNA